jgi:V8-like Glu-specific endopeptidase
MYDETNGKGTNRKDSPLQGEELLRRRFYAKAIGDVPHELRVIDLLPSPPPIYHATIGRADLRATPIKPLAPFRPSWVAGAGRPRRASFPSRPKLKLRHRGAELDPLIVWGADDRRVYNDTSYPWGCVCRIVTAAGTGSGVIVGPRHVLTASHVVDWTKDGAGTVEVHRAGPAVSAMSAITKVWYFTKVGSTEVGYSEVDEDYAVLVTADRLGDRYGWLGVRTYDSDWDDEHIWRNIGYPGDVAGGLYPVYQRDQELDEDEFDYGSGRSMTTSADTAKGQSGSPLFTFWEDGPYVVAVVSAEGTYFVSGDENWCSGGDDMTRLVTYARSSDA